MTLGETIRIFRIANDFTIKDIAEISGIVAPYISNIESNKKNLSLNTLKALAKSFNVPASEILRMNEMSEKENWDYKKTLMETLRIYLCE